VGSDSRRPGRAAAPAWGGPSATARSPAGDGVPLGRRAAAPVGPAGERATRQKSYIAKTVQ